MQRLLDRLADTPVAVYDATWTLIAANAPFDALMGETSWFQGLERNALWRNFVGPANRVVHTPAELAALQAGQVADLRRTAARYPADLGLRRMVRELSAYIPGSSSCGRVTVANPTSTSRSRRSSTTPSSARSPSTVTCSSSRPTT